MLSFPCSTILNLNVIANLDINLQDLKLLFLFLYEGNLRFKCLTQILTASPGMAGFEINPNFSLLLSTPQK